LTKNEFIKYVTGPLFIAFSDRKSTPEMISMYYNELMDIDFKTAELAVNELIETSEYFPTIAAIRKTCARIARPELSQTASEVSKLIQDAIRKFGHPRALEACEYIKQRNPLAYKVVKGIGFINICKSSPEFVYPRIDRLYREEQKALSNAQQLSPDVKYKLETLKNEIQQNALMLESN
jgi:hypothetical protein